MKENNEIIRTIPDGVWESGHTDNNTSNCHRYSDKPKKEGQPPKEGSVEPLPESERPRQDGPGGD